MSKTPSNMMPLGTGAPDFNLYEPLTDSYRSLTDLKSEKATVIMFICNHCPYVKHVQNELVNLASDYTHMGISFVAINSNDAAKYPDDSPVKMKECAIEFKYPFPYLFDEKQDTAKDYMAACTPDFYIFDKNLKCVYRGELDGSRPGNNLPVTGVSVRNALDCILNDKAVSDVQSPSIGCNIKWKE